MRYIAAYYLVLVYVTVMLKPLIPIVSDAMSHALNGAIHVSTVHAKYGSNHLDEELADTASDNTNSKNQNTVKSEEPLPVHISTKECKYDFNVNTSDKQYFDFKSHKLLSVFILKHGPPPKFS